MRTHTVEILESAARRIVSRLVQGEYVAAIGLCESSRLTAADLSDTIADYGRTLVDAPTDAYQSLDVVRINDHSKQMWSLSIPLWTKEEGRSDLTLEMTVSVDGSHTRVALDDLHVL